MTADSVSRRMMLALVLGGPLLLAAAARDDSQEMAGTWSWSWQDPQGKTHNHVLEVVAAGSKVAVRERSDDQEPVSVNDLKVVGQGVNFSVLRGERHAVYAGKRTNAETISGTVTVTFQNRNDEFAWTAKRQPTATR
jgi:opacity protein-like surface antigen